jgi:CubicO group peptidase (beta-lactamase class C family)
VLQKIVNHYIYFFTYKIFIKMSSLTTQVDELFTQWDKPDSPGCALAIVRDGEIIYKRGYGMANLEYNIPISPNSVFDIGSTSKQFTAMCIALLARQNLLSLGDRLQQFIPEIPQYDRPIAIRQLIHHTSGLRDYTDLWDVAGITYGNHYSDEDILALIARQKSLNFQPGTEWRYSNSGYFLLAQIVKRVSGKSLKIFAEDNIFAPLGMKSTHFHDDFREIVKNRADGHLPKEGGGFQIEMSLQNVVGAGGLLTTVEDLSLWDRNFYCNQLGGYGQDLIEQITTPAKVKNNELAYAFGLSIGKHRGSKILSHSGSWKGYRSQMIRFPDRHFSVICLTNLEPVIPHWLALQIADLYLEHEFTEAAKIYASSLVQSIDLPVTELENKVGFYRSATTGNIREIEIKNEMLVMRIVPLEYQLLPIAANQFRLLDGNNGDLAYGYMVYEFPTGGDRMLVHTDTDNSVETSVWERLSADESIQFTDYLGTYYSDELEASKQIILDDDKLHIQGRHTSTSLMKSIGRDLFFMSEWGARLEFLRDANDRVIAFNFYFSTIGRIHFTKQF